MPRLTAATTADRRGMTLLELLLVMGILALVLGVGVGAFARLDFSERTVISELENAVRSAHNWAVAHRAPARIRFDRAAGTARAEGRQVIGTWQFEGLPIRGAFGLDGTSFGGFLDEEGYQGKALSFVGEAPGARVEVQAHRDPAYDLEDGFSVELALNVEKASDATVLALGESVRVEVTRRLSVRAIFLATTFDQDAGGEPRAGGHVILESPAGSLLPGRWYEVGVHYDRAVFRLELDGRVVDAVAETAPVWRVEHALFFGGGRRPFEGRLDSVVISAVAAESELELPVGVTFTKDSAEEIRFDSGGRLDRVLHRKPVALVLQFEDGRQHAIQVNLYGTVE